MLKDKKFSVMGLTYFLQLICIYFYREDEVVDLMNKSITVIDEANLKPNKREFRFYHFPCFKLQQ